MGKDYATYASQLIYHPVIYKIFAYSLITVLYPSIILVRLYERVLK